MNRLEMKNVIDERRKERRLEAERIELQQYEEDLKRRQIEERE